MVMRVGGLATGMDLESIVQKMMDAERIPLTRMEQDRTNLTWKRDAFREINRSLFEMDQLLVDMKFSRNYQTKSVTSSQSNAVTATASTSADNGSYEIEVVQLASSAVNMSAEELGEEGINRSLSGQTISFTTYGPDGEKTHQYTIENGDTIKDVLKQINDDKDNHVRAIYDENANKVIFERTITGEYNQGGKEIVFDDSASSFFGGVLKLGQDGETGGTDAVFKYNGLELTSKENKYSLNNINFEFYDVTTTPARLTVSHDVEKTFDTIMNFVNKYNELVEKLNGTQQEEIFRNYQPLTEEQKEEMSEKQIELWEEKAKSGILRRESSISDGLFSMRQSLYTQVNTGGAITSLTHMGITTSNRYLDGGKLEVNEDELKKAIRENPDEVQKLFSNGNEDDSRGIVNLLQDNVRTTMKRIEERAGKDTSTLDNYTLGKRMKDLNSRISDFEAKLIRLENRYWNQFTQMEKAIQRMNDQSAHLLSQFGGM